MRRPTRRALAGALTAVVLVVWVVGIHRVLGRDDDFLSLLGSSVLGGWLCGVLLLLARWGRRGRRAVNRGPIPTDPAVRRSALLAARRRHRRDADDNWVDRFFAAGVLALITILAIYDSAIFWVPLTSYAALLAYAEWERQVLPRRIELLGSADQ